MNDQTTVAVAVLAAWVPIVVALFTTLGARRAVPFAFFGAFLFLPTYQTMLGPAAILPTDRRTVAGLALLVGVIGCDFRTLVRWRPSIRDLPMLAYVLLDPLVGIVLGPGLPRRDGTTMLLERGLAWGVPYLIGRIYYGDPDGPARLLRHVIWAGLATAPVCLFEMVMGPSYYLAGLLYGHQYQAGMVSRLGGWRPEGFFGNGLTLATWMALAATAAVWAWVGGHWKSRRFPAWAVAVILVFVSVACRGVYGYIALAAGLAVVLTTWAYASRISLMILAGLPILYIATRLGGFWDAKTLTELAEWLVDRGGTVAFRLAAEDEWITELLRRGPVLGTRCFPWNGSTPSGNWPDGWWILVLWTGGLVGLAVHHLALFLAPAELGIAAPSQSNEGRLAVTAGRSLACLVLIHQLDSLHNWAPLTVTALLGGALVGASLAKRTTGSEPSRDDAIGTVRYRVPGFAAGTPEPSASSTKQVVPILPGAALLILVLLLPEIIGEAADRSRPLQPATDVPATAEEP